MPKTNPLENGWSFGIWSSLIFTTWPAQCSYDCTTNIHTWKTAWYISLICSARYLCIFTCTMFLSQSIAMSLRIHSLLLMHKCNFSITTLQALVSQDELHLLILCYSQWWMLIYYYYCCYLRSSVTLRCFSRVVMVKPAAWDNIFLNMQTFPNHNATCTLPTISGISKTSCKAERFLKLLPSAQSRKGTTWTAAQYISVICSARSSYLCIFTFSSFTMFLPQVGSGIIILIG